MALLAFAVVVAACSGSDDAVVDDRNATTVADSVPAPAGSDGDAAAEPPIFEPSAPTTSVAGATDAVIDKAVRTRVDGLIGNGVVPAGFSTIGAQVTSADGDVCTVCLWLADSSDERSRGLMGVTDLGDPVGMAFVWDEPTDGRFFMFQTPAPLSIAWFDGAGEFVAATDMEPCLETDSDRCDRYGAGGAYTVAVEMLQGELGVVGIGPGASIELLVGTESATCVDAR